MRTLKFIVRGRILELDPACDFTGLVPGPNQSIRAEFAFSKEWHSAAKVVAFYSRLGAEYPPRALNDGRSCMIPADALTKRRFKLRVFGTDGLVTNKVTVLQEGG